MIFDAHIHVHGNKHARTHKHAHVLARAHNSKNDIVIQLTKWNEL